MSKIHRTFYVGKKVLAVMVDGEHIVGKFLRTRREKYMELDVKGDTVTVDLKKARSTTLFNAKQYHLHHDDV